MNQPTYSTNDMNELLNDNSDDECDREIQNCDIADGFAHMPQLDTDDEEENRRFRERFNDDPGIRCLMDISLPSPLPMASTSHECKNRINIGFYWIIISFLCNFWLLSIDYEDNQPPSPMGILRESPSPSATKWFEENMSDFSLSSFLGHLDANYDGRRSRSQSRSPSRGVSSIY